MICSHIERVLEKNVTDEELLNKTRSKFHAIEHDIDIMLRKEDADEDKILDGRAKELIRRVLGYKWTSGSIWEKKIKYDIKKEIADSKR